MKQLTLRQIPKDIETGLRKEASQRGTSLNKVAINALEKGLGLVPPTRCKRDLSRFAGKWSAPEVEEFDKNTECFNQIDEELWQ